MTPEPDDSDLLLVLRGLFRSETKAKDFMANHPGISAQDALTLAAQESRKQGASRRKILRSRATEVQLPLLDTSVTSRDAIIYQARAMAISALPYRQSSDTHLTRTIEMADGAMMVFTLSRGDPNVAIPFGVDRLPLVHLADEAVKTCNPEVSFVNAREFLKKFGMTDGGTGYKDFLASIRRIAKMKCTIAWIPPGGTGEGIVNPPEMIRYAYLPTEEDVTKERTGEQPVFPYTLTFGEEFFRELLKDPLPLSLESVVKIRKKKSFLAWDLYQVVQFLRRQAPPGQPIYVPWRNIASMLGAEGEYVRKLKYKIEKQIFKDPDYAHAFNGMKFQGDLLEIPPEQQELSTSAKSPALSIQGEVLIFDDSQQPGGNSSTAKPSTRTRLVKERAKRKPKS